MHFSSGGLIHLIVVAGVLAAAGLIARIARKERAGRPFLVLLGAGLTVFEICWYAYCFREGFVAGLDDLPLHLCNVTVWLTIWILFRQAPAVYDVVYYWALAGMTMALVTPDIKPGEMNYPIVHFFIAHGLVIACVLGIAIGGILRPRPGSWKKAWFCLNGYAVFIMVFNFFAKTNYMYLTRKPAQASLLDYLGPWPWYILPGDLLALGLFWLLYQPWRKGKPN